MYGSTERIEALGWSDGFNDHMTRRMRRGAGALIFSIGEAIVGFIVGRRVSKASYNVPYTIQGR